MATEARAVPPVADPRPAGEGEPGEGCPWPSSVYRWLAGEPADVAPIADLRQFATTLARFLVALQRIDPAGGLPPGPHNFFRGGPLTVYDTETRRAIEALRSTIDAEVATAVWEAALRARWHGPPVWVHGDVAAGNLLVNDGLSSGVIDFGSSGVVDAACDTVIAWTLLTGESREAFQAALPVDNATWARGRGWALWKGLITLAEYLEIDPRKAREAPPILEEVLVEHQHGA